MNLGTTETFNFGLTITKLILKGDIDNELQVAWTKKVKELEANPWSERQSRQSKVAIDAQHEFPLLWEHQNHLKAAY